MLHSTYSSNQLAYYYSLPADRAIRITPSVSSRRAFRVSAARSSGGEERKEALNQQWQEVAPEEQEGLNPGPYGGPPYGGPQYYQQYPAYPPYAPPVEASSGVPWAWVFLGGVSALVISKVWDFFSPSGGGPQAKMMNFMMKQAMKGAGGAAPAGFPDFSKVGAPPSFPGGFPNQGFPSVSSGTGGNRSPVFDAQAKTVDEQIGTSRSSSVAESSPSRTVETSKPGAKFEELKAQSRQRRKDPETASKRRAFTDVDDEEEGDATSSARGATNGAVEPDRVTVPGGGSQADGANMDLLEQFMQDPAMQKLLYEYLPESMRNKEAFDFVLKDPEYRAQLENMLKSQGAALNPDVYKQMQNINSEDVTRQLAQHGMTPADVIQKIMSEPELAAAFSKPQVQQAILELQNDPMSIIKYQNDADVMLVFEKMTQMFPQMSQ